MFGFNSNRLKIKKFFNQDLEPHEVFLDLLARKQQERAGVSEKKMEVPLSKSILGIFYLCFLLMVIVFFAKTFQLQIIEGKTLSNISEENRFKVYSIQAERGVMYDNNGIQMISNMPAFNLICQKNNLPENSARRKQVLYEIARIVGKDVETIEQQIQDSDSSVVKIFENLPHPLIIALETRLDNLPGFEVVNNTAREYKDGIIFSHVIGYKREGGESAGLENFYNEILEQKVGKMLAEKDAKGNVISKKIVFLPKSGNSLGLYLDSELQKKIYEALGTGVGKVGSTSGIGVAIDPRNGGVLAIVSLPGYDNNLFSQTMSAEQWQELSQDKTYPMLNRVISGTYPTGSTIKPLIACAALEEKIISPNKKIHCTGEIKIENKLWPEQEPEFWRYRDWSIHGYTDVRKAIAESCNVFFYTMGGGYKDFKGLGVERIKQYLTLFGWGKKTNIDLPGEKDGLVPDPEWREEHFTGASKIWGRGHTYHLSIGQGDVSATPLQLAMSSASIANNGILYEPRIVEKIINSDGNEQFTDAKIIRQDFISKENLEVVRQGMRQTVTGKNSPQASAVLLNSLPVKSAAKTGTAQTGIKEQYHNWVTVFAPYENPEIVLVIMIEYIEGDQVVVLPVAKEILNWYFGDK
jgi:penicillin-binding protein 2